MTDKSLHNMGARPVVPEGGWGWVVVFGSFLTFIIFSGTQFTFGVFLTDLIDHFGHGRGLTSYVGSLCIGVSLICGPLVSFLANRYGTRSVTTVGSVLGCVGLAASSFSPNIWFMYVSYGFIAGVGLGMVYLPAFVNVALYFHKKLSLATGIALCGAGVGTFIYAPLVQFLIDSYGWRGAMLIEGGLLLNFAVFGALARPLPVKTLEENSAEVEKIYLTECTLRKEADNGGTMQSSVVELSSRTNDLENGTLTKDVVEMSVVRNSVRTCLGETESPTSISICSDNAQRTESRSSREENSQIKCLSTTRWRRFFSLPKSSLLRDPVFIIFATSSFFISVGYGVPFIYLPDLAKQLNIPDTGAVFLVSTIGIFNSLARIIFGWISNFQFANRFVLFIIVWTLCGVSTCLSFLATNYKLLMIYACVFGLFIGAYTCLSPVITADLWGHDRYTQALGLVTLFQGFGCIVGPPIAGWLFDITRDYDVSFIIIGAVISLSGLILIPLPRIKRCQNRNRYDDD